MFLVILLASPGDEKYPSSILIAFYRDMLVYKNLLRAIDNMGINSAYGFKYYLKGNLSEKEKLTFLRTQVTSKEYLQQVKNFSPYMRKKVNNLEDSLTYQKFNNM